MKHSERIFQILEDRKITAYQLSKATGIAESSFGQWRKTPSSNIRSGNLVLIADYLNCSVDYLLGRTEDPELHQKYPQSPQISATSGPVRVDIYGLKKGVQTWQNRS